ncbi:MAG: hypothetical protein M3Y70_11635 [Pseudomonadota bacterium]|nr:hypothetical protein [Pseudomonadota bacterium]
MSDATHSSGDRLVLGALALELTPGSAVDRDRLEQAGAGSLGERIAADLARFQADASLLELSLVGAHYDPVELLRRHWPLHRELDQLAARAPGDRTAPGGRIVAFGARDGQLPGILAPTPEYAGGPLRLVPFVLGGDPEVAAQVGDAFERDLVETGMAGADTALMAQELFGLRVEHARYLTLHDLLAMTAMQYEHAGLAPLWPLLEAALLAPGAEEWLDAPPEPLAHFSDGEVRIALFSPAAWHARYQPGLDDDARLARGFEQFQLRQRQFAAVLGAHGVPVTFAHCGASETPDL